jgi:hypothetical protein
LRREPSENKLLNEVRNASGLGSKMDLTARSSDIERQIGRKIYLSVRDNSLAQNQELKTDLQPKQLPVSFKIATAGLR